MVKRTIHFNTFWSGESHPSYRTCQCNVVASEHWWLLHASASAVIMAVVAYDSHRWRPGVPFAPSPMPQNKSTAFCCIFRYSKRDKSFLELGTMLRICLNCKLMFATSCCSFSAFRGQRLNGMDFKIASFSSRARFGICAGPSPVASRVPPLVRRAVAALLPARPSLHASATSTLYRNGSALDVALLSSG